MWKSKDYLFWINNKNRKHVKSANDERVDSYLQFADWPFYLLKPFVSNAPFLYPLRKGEKGCIGNEWVNPGHNQCFAPIFKNCSFLHQNVVKNKGFRNFLAGGFRNDRLVVELEIYRKSTGASYNISVIQIMNSLALLRLRLFSKLDIEKVFIHTFAYWMSTFL